MLTVHHQTTNPQRPCVCNIVADAVMRRSRCGMYRAMMAATMLIAVVSIVSGCKPPDIEIPETPVSVIQDDVGHGREATDGDVVRIAYTVREQGSNRTILHDEDFRFKLGRGAVILGVDQAIPGMKEGGRRVFTCPPQKHWGRPGHGGNNEIPPNATLIIEIRLLDVE